MFFHRDPLTRSNSKQPRRDAVAYFIDTVWMSEGGKRRHKSAGSGGGAGGVGERARKDEGGASPSRLRVTRLHADLRANWRNYAVMNGEEVLVPEVTLSLTTCELPLWIISRWRRAFPCVKKPSLKPTREAMASTTFPALSLRSHEGGEALAR